MPLFESTMAMVGPSSKPCLTAASTSARSSAGRPSTALSTAPSPSLGDAPTDASEPAYLSKTSGKKARTTCPKMIGSETFIIVALRCTEKRTPSALARCDLLGEEVAQLRHVHERRVDDLTGEDGDRLLEHRGGPVGTDELDAQGVVGRQDDGRLVVAEVVRTHRRDVGLGLGAPGAHGVRVLAGVALHRRRRATVRVAFAQHGVDGRSLDLVVGRPGRLLVVGGRVVGVVGQRVAGGLQLGDRDLELRDRRRHVGQLDDVGLGRLGQGPELGQGVADALLGLEGVGERGDDATRQRDVTRLDLDAGLLGEGRDDGQQRGRGQGGRLVRVRVDDCRVQRGCSVRVAVRAEIRSSWISE